jgi:hypothetical protein
MNAAWQLPNEHTTSSAGISALPNQMRTNQSKNPRLWEPGPVQCDPIGTAAAFPQHRFALGPHLHDHPSSPWSETEAKRTEHLLQHPPPSNPPDP